MDDFKVVDRLLRKILHHALAPKSEITRSEGNRLQNIVCLVESHLAGRPAPTFYFAIQSQMEAAVHLGVCETLEAAKAVPYVNEIEEWEVGATKPKCAWIFIKDMPEGEKSTSGEWQKNDSPNEWGYHGNPMHIEDGV